MFTVMICEDDFNIRRLIRECLTREGYLCLEAENGQAALSAMEREHVDLIITDYMMPEMDGIELLGELRSAGYSMPILMITVRETLEDKRRGFRAGADDYMVKPVDTDEMLLRVEALLRRYEIARQKSVTVGNCTLDYDARELRVHGQPLTLAKKEFLILFMLLSTPNRIYTRRQIMDECWNYDSESDERTVDVHIKRLREKCQGLDFEIVTALGLGYKAVI